MIIDAYTHWTPFNYVRFLKSVKSTLAKNEAEHISSLSSAKPGFFDPEARISDMNQYKFESQVTMVHSIIEPNTLNLSPDENLKGCKLINNDLAELYQTTKGRIIPVGSVPLLSDAGLMRDEIRRCTGELGIKGFMVPTNCGGAPVDTFIKFWEEMDRIGLPVYIHPVDAPAGSTRPYEMEYDLMHVVGWPHETALIWLRMVKSGLLDKYRRLKIVTHHMGGTIPYLLGRIEESFNREASKVLDSAGNVYTGTGSVLQYLRRFYYDTAIGGNPYAVELGTKVFDISQIIFSTDYPWGPQGGKKRMETYPGIIRNLSIPEESKEDIFYRNASKLLGI